MAWRAVMVLVLVVAGAACIDAPLVACPESKSCLAAQVAACEGKAAGDSCHYAQLAAGVCSPTLVCVPIGCGNGALDPGEECDDGNMASGDGCTNCQLPRCGDNVTDLAIGEVCDDGNNLSGDQCSANCRSNETCGNGTVDVHEECDDGNLVDHDGCQHDCKNQRCGDGTRDPDDGEECDDGNANNTDSCPSSCRQPFCGDGFVQAGVEQCDDGNTFGNDLCPRSCLRTCGDLVVDPGEDCDDGNQNNSDYCTNECRMPCRRADGEYRSLRVGATCYTVFPYPAGATWLDVEQACNTDGGHIISLNSYDDQLLMPYLATYGSSVHSTWLGINDRASNGNYVWSDGSPTSYQNWALGYPIPSTDCGFFEGSFWQWKTASCSSTLDLGICEGPPCNDDGVLDPGELCDDGNLDDGDACTSWCTPAACGDGAIHAGFEQCDDGNGNDNDTCRNSCQTNTCGNSASDPGEQCDDGNNNDYDDCVRCKTAFCGDGFARVGVEQCDDGNGVNTDGCAACRTAVCGDGFVRAGIEDCDDANANPYDGCERCHFASCGNHIVETGEVCDDGNTTSGDACAADCASTCGSGTVEAGEQCDDGNSSDADFCRNDCTNPCGYYDYGQQAMIVGTNGNCYAVMPGMVTYAEAVLSCSQLAGTAEIAESDGNGEFLVGAQITAVFAEHWIGVTDLTTEGTYLWNNGDAATVSNWATAEPDDTNGSQNCVSIGYQGLWSDEDCATPHPFVCLITGS